MLAAFSNHASELYCVRSISPDDIAQWGAVRSVDEGRSTYSSLAPLPDGRIALLHTLQHNPGQYEATEWRETNLQISSDGGDSWDQHRVLGFGPGTFPYSTAISVSETGLIAFSFALYSSAKGKHLGLSLVTVNPLTLESQVTEVIPPKDDVELIPYESFWVAPTKIAISFSESAAGKMRAAFVTVDLKKKTIHRTNFGQIATHSYASGVAMAPDASIAVICPPSGGLRRIDLRSGSSRLIERLDSFACPQIRLINSTLWLSANRNQRVSSTRDFYADLYIRALN